MTDYDPDLARLIMKFIKEKKMTMRELSDELVYGKYIHYGRVMEIRKHVWKLIRGGYIRLNDRLILEIV